ncbi:MAG: hypothetical protein GEU71_05270 [Actinobacteria bacterium]|nr:hypothetical protein [Actinomycetota bacterium]
MTDSARPFDDPDDIPTSPVPKGVAPPSERSRGNVTPRVTDSTPQASPEAAGRSPYSEIVRDQLLEERARKKSLEQRGFSVMSVAGFLGSIVFGAVGLIRSGDDPIDLPFRMKVVVGFALVCLLAAAVLGMFANFIRNYQELAIDAIPDLYRRLPDPPASAERRVFRLRSNLLWDAQRNNDFKARCVRAALILEVLAAAAVIFAAIDIVLAA